MYKTLAPRLIRFRDAPRYLGMDRNRFNAEVRPILTEIPIGARALPSTALNSTLGSTTIPSRNGRPGRSKGGQSWDARRCQASSSEAASGMSTSTSAGGAFARALAQLSLEEAEQYLARLMEETRQAQVYGVRPSRTFEKAAAKFVLENQHKRSLGRRRHAPEDAHALDRAGVPRQLHMGTLQPWIEHGRGEGMATGTINHGLKIVRRILNLAASEWVDEQGLTWLLAAPKIKLLPEPAQAATLSAQLGGAGATVQGASRLPGRRWHCLPSTRAAGTTKSARCGGSGRLPVPQVATSVFIVPGTFVKNGDERLVVLNRLAMSVVEARRGQHPDARVHLQGQADHAHAHLGLEAGARAGRSTASARA